MRFEGWRWALVASALAGAYAGVHAALDTWHPVGDAASYLERAAGLRRAVLVGDLRAIVRVWSEIGHRPWPGLLGVYVGGLLNLPLAALVGLQATWASALLGAGVHHLGRALSWSTWVQASVLTTLLGQPIWRATTATPLADAALLGIALLTLGLAARWLRDVDEMATPSQAPLASAIACAPAIKPGGMIWVVMPILLALFVESMLAPVELRRRRLLRWCEVAGMVAALLPVTLVVAGGPKVFSAIRAHGVVIEALGCYDESVSTVGQATLWMALAPFHLATLPLALSAMLGGLRTLRVGRDAAAPGRWAGIALLAPLLVHAYLMSSKSMRLLVAGLAPMAVLAAVGWSTLAMAGQRLVGVAACLLWFAGAGWDLTAPSMVPENLDLFQPTGPDAWRSPPMRWLGHVPTSAGAQAWPMAGKALQNVIDANCDPKQTVLLFAEPRLHPGGSSSDYSLGIGAGSFYVPDAQVAPPFAALMARRGCLVDHPNLPLYWPDGRDRIDGEAMNRALHVALLTGQPLVREFAKIAEVPLPDGHAVAIYRRAEAAPPAEQLTWNRWLRSLMPGSGAWARLAGQSADQLAQAGQLTVACELWLAAAATRPYRGLIACPQFGSEVCAQTDEAAAAARAARKAGCAPAPDRSSAGSP
jgi:hypothetical protein